MLESRTCDDETIKNNSKKVAQGHFYGPVNVLVIGRSFDSNSRKYTLKFYARTSDGDDRELSMTWGDQSQMWIACPSTLPSLGTPEEPGEAPQANTQGILYIHLNYIGQFGLKSVARPKWPSAFEGGATVAARSPFIPHKTIDIWPTQILVTGRELQNRGKGTVDLLDPSFVIPDYTITSSVEQRLSLKLTPKGCNVFGVNYCAWEHLAEAVKIVRENPPTDPRALAAAWEVIALAVDRLEIDRAQGLVDDDNFKLLQGLLPHLV